MKAKLPYSGGESKQDLKSAHQKRMDNERKELVETYNDSKDKRVELGLVPSKTNKSKQLTSE